MREARAKPIRDHEKLGTHSKLWINCGDYEISYGALGRAVGTFHKDQIV